MRLTAGKTRAYCCHRPVEGTMLVLGLIELGVIFGGNDLPSGHVGVWGT